MQIIANQLFNLIQEISYTNIEDTKNSKNLSNRLDDDSHNNNYNQNNIIQKDSNISKIDLMIIKLLEIIQLNNEPVKLFFLFLMEISNLFELHSQYINQNPSRISKNILYLDRVLSKIVIVIEKFLKINENEICNIELEKIIAILMKLKLHI